MASSRSAMLGPDDPQLSVDPEVATFVTGGGRSKHVLANLGDTRLAVKVRCSDNQLYRVYPVYSLIDAGQCQEFHITRLPGPAKCDKIVLQYVKCTESDNDAQKVFKASTVTPPTAKIILRCLEKDDTPSVIGSPASPSLSTKDQEKA
ncbi:MSP domain-containing protein [Aphelenchoides avenae]|nr:MSP domain-containing protein [Aphelenchus avenae]